ncbi:MAG: twin-arginine translocase subunit TatC [Ignavibacteriales bacterium]
MEDTTFTEDKIHEPGEMSFLDHLEELRWRIIYAMIGVVIGTIICWVFSDFLITKILLAPALKAGIKLQNLRPFGQIMLYFEIALVGGAVLSLPNLIYQLWKFIEPALRQSEKKYISAIVLFTTFCFLAGIAFAYFVMLPMTFGFAASFGTKAIENNFAVDEYLSIIVSIMLGAGVVFELPMLSFFLSKIGILKPRLMKHYRKHAIVVIMILSAFLTPGTDPVSQLVLAVPLVFLYEISIFVSKMSQRKS